MNQYMESAMIDTHCHMASEQFDKSEIPELIELARKNHISSAVTLGTCPEDWGRNLELARENPDFFSVALGIHPCDAEKYSPNSIELLASQLTEIGVVALGEIGLDYFHPAPEGEIEENWRKKQQDCLSAQIKLADDLNLPVVIHTRDKIGQESFDDALRILAPYAGKLRAVFHCFIGNEDQMKTLFDLGFIVSFTGIATFPKSQQLRELIKKVPAGKFMLETDSPYLTPVPYRGKRNHPAMTYYTALAIAELRGESFEQLDAHTTNTAREFFNLK